MAPARSQKVLKASSSVGSLAGSPGMPPPQPYTANQHANGDKSPKLARLDNGDSNTSVTMPGNGSSDLEQNSDKTSGEADDEEDTSSPSTNAPPRNRPQELADASWTGLSGNDATRNESETNAGAAMQTDADTAAIENMENYDFSDAASEASITTVADIDLEDDDDYDAVDNISVVSEDSANFEQEVENDLQAEGEDNIDWDDYETYAYDASWMTGQYGQYDLAHGIGGLDPTAPTADYDISLLRHNDHAQDRMTQSAPELPLRDSASDWRQTNSFLAGDALLSSLFGDDSSHSSSSQDTPPSTPRMYDTVTPQLNHQFLQDPNVDDSDDETEYDVEEVVTSNSGDSSLIYTYKPVDNNKRVPQRVTVPESNTRVALPPTRTLTTDRKRPIAYSIETPFGRQLRFIPAKGQRYQWVVTTPKKIRSSANTSGDASSISNSGASSPTMIDIDAARFNGNTRTGAVITDHVYAAIFRSENCRPDSSSSQEAPPLSSFYRNIIENTPVTEHVMHDWLHFEDELIDFEQCDEPSTSATPATPGSATPAPSKGKGRLYDLPTTAFNDMFATPMSPVTPSPLLMGNLAIKDSTSPRKRRLSHHSVDNRPDVSSSPLVKKNRIEAAQ